MSSRTRMSFRPRSRRGRRRRAPAAAMAIAVTCTVALSGGSAAAHDRSPNTPDSTVAAWDRTGVEAAAASGFSPAEGHMLFAYVAIAVYDAVVAVQGDGDHFAVDVDAPRGASAEAAASAAAYRVLMHPLPAQAPTSLDPADPGSRAESPDGPAETAGVAVGEQVAAALIELRRDDGFRVPVPYAPPVPAPAGTWIPTASTPPIGTFLPGMRPFALRSADQFRPDGPPDLDSRRWARDFAEVKAIGSATSTVRTPDQTAAARFWGEPPVPQARASFRLFLDQHDLDIGDAARFMAMMSVTYADALIACFDAKYTYAFWRPVTAIPAGDTDGNRRTIADPAWTPLIPTPNHPEYPSAHGCITPTAGIVISRFLHTAQIDFTVPSITGGADRHFATRQELTRDVSDARIWGGVHFRSAVDDGVDIAERTARYVLRHHFDR